MSHDERHGYAGVLKAAALFTGATACFGLLAENFAVAVNEGLLPGWHPGLRALLGMALFAVLTFGFWKVDGIALLIRRRTAPRTGQPDFAKVILALFLFTLMAAAHGFLGINLAQAMHHYWHFHGWPAVAVGAIAFFLFVLAFWRLRDRLAGIFAASQCRSDGVAIRDDMAPKYVAMLSVLSSNTGDPSDTSACDEARRRFDVALQSGGDWTEALEALTIPINDESALYKWNGQPPLRSLKDLITNFDDRVPFRLIKMLCTAESAERFAHFSELLRHILRKHPHELVQKITVEKADGELTAGGDWQVNQLVFEDELHKLRTDPRCKRGKICIEITGGTVDLSIVGAIATVSKTANFRYVFTNNSYIVHDYDLQSRDTPME